MLVAARSEAAVVAEAKKGGWARFRDGCISGASRQTVQRGISRDEIVWLFGAAGIEVCSSNSPCLKSKTSGTENV